jgi:protein-S-isoprenylcysteine O-methyltransferase Ste14
MPDAAPEEPLQPLSDTRFWPRLGGWLFARRSWLPAPLALALLAAPPTSASFYLVPAGLVLVLLGEALRLWGVHHIGAVSRTRADRLGPLVASGPFAYVRNPLYLGNIGLWVGFALSARTPRLAPIIAGLLAVEYHAIVAWEEQLLESRLGRPYREYRRHVPRWVPSFTRDATASASVAAGTPFSWRATLFSERGTLIAIAAGYVLLALKGRLAG